MSHPSFARRAGAVVAALSLAGLVNASVLTREHFLFHTDPSYLSFCDLTEDFTCKGVALSPWSVILGVPVSVWGMLGTLALGIAGLWLATRRNEERPAAGALLMLSGGALASSIVLSGISTFLIGALCPLCLLSHVLNLSIAGVALVTARKAGGIGACVAALLELVRARWMRAAGFGTAAAATAGSLLLWYPAYWSKAVAPPAGPALHTGVTEQGSPWIGAEHPDVVVTEYSDYQCPHCRKAHQQVRSVVAQNPSCLRLVHCQFPLDPSCNPSAAHKLHDRACELACMAVCAGEQGKFWAANDFLFSCEDQESLRRDDLVRELILDPGAFDACMQSDRAREAIRRDVEEAALRGVRVTPTFVVDGKAYPGRLPDKVVHHVHSPG